ncbi:MAG: ferric reductase-like transmembrane domain-containing protein [Candidatus Planktophila sp.]
MSNASPIKYSSGKGVDGAALIAGLGLGLTIAMQLTSMSRADISSVYAAITSFSRLCALVGTYFSVLGIFLIARIPIVERGVGHDRLVTWHRKLGPYSLFLIGFHVFFVILGYAGQDQIPLYKELWNVLHKFYWMWAGLGGFVLMILAGVTSYKKARANMSYETWWIIHIYTYAAVALSFMHQVLNGSMFIGHPLARLYWTALYVLMGASVLYWRIGLPLARSLRHNLKVDRVVIEGPDVVSVIMRGRKLHKLAAQGGQFFSWHFLEKGHLLVAHPYSLSAAPTEHFIRITVKGLGDHSRSLASLQPGTRVFVEGPYGAFTAGRASSPHIVLVGGGVGITPIRAIIEEFKNGVQLDIVYRASKKEDLVLREEIDYLVANSDGTMRAHYLVGSRKDHPMDAKSLTELVPSFADSDIYICGPGPLVESVRKAAQDVGVPKDKFHDEAFGYHTEIK